MRLSALLEGPRAAGVAVDQTGDGDPEIAGLTADSRQVRPGFVFAALKGVKADGLDYVPQAVAAGAAAVLGPASTPAQSIATLRAGDPRAALAHMAARFHRGQPAMIAAVTGTNGKTSTAEFLRQIWAHAGQSAASLGTLGVTRGDGSREELGFTTPDPVAVHRVLDRLAGEGVTHLAMEASSHGLDQRRMDGARVMVAGFTNLTQDHLDYHETFEAYFAAKLRLFAEVCAPDAVAVINVDTEFGRRAAEASRARGLTTRTVGWRGDAVRLREVTPRASSQLLDLLVDGRPHAVTLPLAGEFQALNALQALAMAMASGERGEVALSALERLRGVRGRLEVAGTTAQGAPVFVDYAHTPDGLDKALRALRPHTAGRLIVVFGCGGDRDPHKRQPMGDIAARRADHVIITDDNPRSEDPGAIRSAALAGAPEAEDIADRGAAIRRGVALLRPGDALVVAGKGHETGQIIGAEVIPFDDVKEAQAALAALRA